ncbi:hypothetical protein [Rhizobium sp. BK176]|uniref:hypothetical protein n=1 Tax=Rhizobium sp. BK176 TaxID=2587071 RepID=UPI002168C517|nr:hypothetical protein [Rhizobium sp. BK176]MCS4090157.1 hypothetical protein [Rhizobium sp. BK176]
MAGKVSRKLGLPTGDFLEHGYGRAPVHRNLREIRRMAASITLRLLDGETPDPRAKATVNGLADAADLFRIAGQEDANDWYTVHKSLGQPSATLCLEISSKLLEVRSLLTTGDERAARRVLDELADDALPDMLENYVNSTKHQNATAHTESDGWAYVLWSSGEPEAVIAAVTELTIDEALADMKASKGHPLGVLAAWQVYRPSVAAEKLSELLANLRLDGDLYVVERGTTGTATLGTIKDSIEAMLVADDLLVRSPWHFDEKFEAAEPTPKAVGLR